MPTPLQTYKKVAKDFGVTDELNVHTEGKLAFAREQSTQMKLIVNRLLFDLTQTLALEKDAKDDQTRDAYEAKRRTYERDLRQTVASLKTTNALVAELETELPQE